MAMKKPSKKTQNPLATPGGGAKGGSMGTGGAGRSSSRTYKVSENVTVKAKKGAPSKPSMLKGAEQARAQNAKSLAKPSKKDVKKSAKALEASGKPSKSKKANTKMYQYDYVDGKFTRIDNTARGFAQEKSLKKNPNVRKRAGFRD